MTNNHNYTTHIQFIKYELDKKYEETKIISHMQRLFRL